MLVYVRNTVAAELFVSQAGAFMRLTLAPKGSLAPEGDRHGGSTRSCGMVRNRARQKHLMVATT
jgi:hypothetical protein